MKRKNKKLSMAIAAVILVIAFLIGCKTGIIDPADYGLENVFGDGGTREEFVTNDNEGSCIVHYIDVGQGACALVEFNGHFMLIDAGENGHETAVINYLHSVGVKKFDYIIATHQHSDHIGGMPEVLEEFSVDNIIMPRLTEKQTPTNSTYKAFLNAVSNSGAKVISAKPGSSYAFEDAKFTILGPVSNQTDNLNSMSAVTRLEYGNTSFLFDGDAEKDEEKEIVATGAKLKSNVLLVGHHGSKTSSCKEFLDEVQPEICVIQCGKNNDYGHPHDAALKRLENHTDRIYRTDYLGNIVITSDGNEITVDYDNK